MKMNPASRILGVKIVREIDPVTKLERQVWRHPEPVTHVYHFVNAAWKRKFKAGTLDEKDGKRAIRQVPIYAGMDRTTWRYLRSQHEYAMKLASPAWQEKANLIRGAA